MKTKTWIEYTAKELLKIYENKKEWENFFEFQCANKGIEFLPVYPGEKPIELKPNGDIEVFCIKDMRFKNEKEAEEVYKLIEKSELLDYTYVSSFKTIKPKTKTDYDYPKFKIEYFYSKELIEDIKVEVGKNKQQIETWTKLNDKYKSIKSLRDELLDSIMEPINEAKEERQLHSSMLYHYKEYLKLAENSKNIARDFLTKTYPRYKEKFPEFFIKETEKENLND